MIRMICDICGKEDPIWHCGFLRQSRKPNEDSPSQEHIDGSTIDLCEACKQNAMYVQDAIVVELKRRARK